MPKTAKSNSNTCEVCREVFVVDSLARVCEDKHNANATKASPGQKNN
jgi:hypothetical protein